MGHYKDQMIEQIEEEREDLGLALDVIEALGEGIKCPGGYCDSQICGKSCFDRSCFYWCVIHHYPSVEEIDGVFPVTVSLVTKDSGSKLVSRTEVEERRLCWHQDARTHPGDCRIVTAPSEDMLWEFEEQRRM